jgi:hypothetical protein
MPIKSASRPESADSPHLAQSPFSIPYLGHVVGEAVRQGSQRLLPHVTDYEVIANAVSKCNGQKTALWAADQVTPYATSIQPSPDLSRTH